jgi:hypothetical protein
MAVNNPNPSAQAPANNPNLIESFPGDFDIIVNICKTLKSLADSAVLKRKSEFYFEAFYAMEKQLFKAWFNILGQAIEQGLVLGPTPSQRAVDQHHTFATAVTLIQGMTRTHEENYTRQKQGQPLVPPNFDFFHEMQNLSATLAYFCH